MYFLHLNQQFQLSNFVLSNDKFFNISHWLLSKYKNQVSNLFLDISEEPPFPFCLQHQSLLSHNTVKAVKDTHVSREAASHTHT